MHGSGAQPAEGEAEALKFDKDGKRVAARPFVAENARVPAYWYGAEKVEAFGFCDEPIECTEGLNITHLCGRFRGHGGRCAALNGSKRLEYG